jgi:hypothetical protein
VRLAADSNTAAQILYAAESVGSELGEQEVAPNLNPYTPGAPPQSPYEYTNNLPSCVNQTPAEVIRNNGLYGVKGDYNCDIMKRRAVMDTGFVQPLGARAQWAQYLGYDMPNKRNQFMQRAELGPTLMR